MEGSEWSQSRTRCLDITSTKANNWVMDTSDLVWSYTILQENPPLATLRYPLTPPFVISYIAILCLIYFSR